MPLKTTPFFDFEDYMTLNEALTNIHNVLMTVQMTIPQGKIVLESMQIVTAKCKQEIPEKEIKDGNT